MTTDQSSLSSDNTCHTYDISGYNHIQNCLASRKGCNINIFPSPSYHGNAGPCRWPQGRSLRCLPGSDLQGAPPSPDTGLHYPRIQADTHNHAGSGRTRLLSDQFKARIEDTC